MPLLSLFLFFLAVLSSPSGRAAGPTTQPQGVHVQLPDGWVDKKSAFRDVLQAGEYPELKAHFDLFADAKEDLTADVDLMAWAKKIKANTSTTSKLLHREETEIKQRTIAGRAVVEYEVTGELDGFKYHYRKIMLECGDYFCDLSCWTVPSHWSEDQAQFDQLVANLRSSTP